MKKIFQRVIVDFQERKLPELIEREYEVPIDTKKIISLIGIRRSGKTSILFNIIKKLQSKKKIPKENIIYINFEDDRLFDATLIELDDLIKGYYELYPKKRDEKVYFFFDEIQNIKNWELFVRRIYDTLNIQIYITGSSSKLLSAEIATSLRGRTIVFEIFPFSFKELLLYKKIKINLNSSNSLSHIKNSFESYLIDGGFPECVDEDKFIRKKILRDYMDLIIYKDIIERHSIKNRELLKHLIKYCFTNIGTLLSINKFYNELKSLGFKLSKDSLFEYFSFLEEAFTFFRVPIYRNSIEEELRHSKKIYAIDNSLRSLFTFSFSDDFGKLYENLTYLHLRRNTNEIYYYKVKQEVDFLAIINGEKKILINVCYDLSNAKTKKREISGLVEAMTYFNLKESILVTNDEEESIIEIDDYKIYIKPLYLFLLEKL